MAAWAGQGRGGRLGVWVKGEGGGRLDGGGGQTRVADRMAKLGGAQRVGQTSWGSICTDTRIEWFYEAPVTLKKYESQKAARASRTLTRPHASVGLRSPLAAQK